VRLSYPKRRLEISARNLRSSSPVSDKSEVVLPAQKLGRIENRIQQAKDEDAVKELIDELNEMNKPPNQVPSELQERLKTALSLLEKKIREIQDQNRKYPNTDLLNSEGLCTILEQRIQYENEIHTLRII